MPDNAELIETYDGKLRKIMLDMRHDGIRHEAIYHVFNELTLDIKAMAKAESELSPAHPEKSVKIV